MDFLSSLNIDVKLLLVAAALALVAGLLSGTKKNEHRYLFVFTLLMVAAGVRFHQESNGGGGEQARAGGTAVSQKATRSLAR